MLVSADIIEDVILRGPLMEREVYVSAMAFGSPLTVRHVLLVPHASAVRA